jgi:enediyne biosynthesis protein E4
VALSDDGMEQGGMGVGIGDYDVDGLDLFQTHFMGDTCGIYRNDGKGNFEDRTRAAKIGVETRFVSWGTGGVDLDNDGYPDIFLLREVFSQRWSANSGLSLQNAAHCFSEPGRRNF